MAVVRFLTIFLIAGLSSCALVGTHDKAVDAAKIQGEWRVTHLEEEGEKAPPDRAKEFVYSFAGDKLSLKHAGKVVAEGTFKLNPSADPKEIDMVLRDETNRGISKLERDRLIICASAFKGNTRRPTTFESRTGSRTMLVEMERVKR